MTSRDGFAGRTADRSSAAPPFDPIIIRREEGNSSKCSVFQQPARLYDRPFVPGPGVSIQDDDWHPDGKWREFCRRRGQGESGEKTISVKTGVLVFGEITGIVERQQNMAEVTYTEKTTDITPFGQRRNIAEGTTSRTAMFTRYDDGWRLTR